MKAVIAIDSFKGHLTALEAAEEAASMIARRYPGIETDILPSSDGGEGFCSIVTEALGGRMIRTMVPDPLGRPIEAAYGLRGGTAVIECAAANGLTLLTEDELDPMRASSRGTGALIADAIMRGCRDIYVGLGGSATVDGGLGILEALACAGKSGNGGSMDLETTIRLARSLAEGCRITAICDVEATFCGPQGAAAVYGPQKGASPQQVPVLDARLGALAGEYAKVLGRDVLTQKGTGAAGGMSGAIWSVLGGDIRPGADAVLDLLDFEKHLEGADIVITGEGRLDAQTFQGKLPYAVASRTKRKNPDTRVIAFVGISDYPEAVPPFDELICRG